MKQKKELKPCPFCGSTKIKLWHSPFGVGGRCEICGASSGFEAGEARDCDATKEQAAAVWNKRVDITKHKCGKWIQVDDNKCQCSNCGVITFIAVYPNGNKNYCPNCGAKMRERNNGN